MTGTLIERLWESDEASRLTNEAARELEARTALIAELVESLQWMVDNDETNEGDTPLPDQGGRSWNEINEYWIEHLNTARAVLSKAKSTT